MFDVSMAFIFQNVVFLMLIFWLLSWLGDRFYKHKWYKSGENVYECGFNSTHALRVTLNFGFFIVALLLILYDIEFFFLIPMYFNFYSYDVGALVVYWVFLIFVVLSFAVDWETVSLKWLG